MTSPLLPVLTRRPLHPKGIFTLAPQSPVAVSSATVPVTWNPADKSGALTLSTDNLSASNGPGNPTWANVRATKAGTTPFYFEVLITAGNSFGTSIVVGVGDAAAGLTSFMGGSSSNGYFSGGSVFGNAASASYPTYTVGDVIGVACDPATGKTWFAKNNVWQGDPVAGTGAFTNSGTLAAYYPMAGLQNSNDSFAGRFNAASQSYAAPTGFSAIEASSASATVTGTIASTEGTDTLSATGASTITGSAASTEGTDTSSASGSVTVTGSAASTEGTDTAAGSGAVAISGSVSSTEANDTASISGTVTVTGSASPAESNDNAALSGSVSVTGTIARTEATDTASGSGTVAVAGSGAITEGTDSLAASGTVITGIVGTAAITEASDTASATGASTVSGSIAGTEANDNAAIVGSVAILSTGTIAANDNADVMSALGNVVQRIVIHSRRGAKQRTLGLPYGARVQDPYR